MAVLELTSGLLKSQSIYSPRGWVCLGLGTGVRWGSMVASGMLPALHPRPWARGPPSCLEGEGVLSKGPGSHRAPSCTAVPRLGTGVPTPMRWNWVTLTPPGLQVWLQSPSVTSSSRADGCEQERGRRAHPGQLAVLQQAPEAPPAAPCRRLLSAPHRRASPAGILAFGPSVIVPGAVEGEDMRGTKVAGGGTQR